jgi:hypothetical protein
MFSILKTGQKTGKQISLGNWIFIIYVAFFLNKSINRFFCRKAAIQRFLKK